MEGLTTTALHVICRGVADQGEDYGWSVYHRGYTIPPAAAKRMIRDDEQAAEWIAAYRYVMDAYRNATGQSWRY